MKSEQPITFKDRTFTASEVGLIREVSGLQNRIGS